MSFATPQALWLLLLLPLVAIARGRAGAAPAMTFPSADLVRAAAGTRRARSGRPLTTLRIASVALAILALARPQQGIGTAEIEASGISIVLALDVSGSMRALDFQLDGQPASRLDVVKSVVRRFVDARPNDQIGLVAFAGSAFLVSPVTLDHGWIDQSLGRLKMGLVDDGTAIGSGLATALNHLRDQKARSKIVILLTDGQNNAGKVAPLTAAEAARSLGVKVYTIGAGTKGEAPMPVTDAFGRERVVMTQVDVDEQTLEKIADLTNGRFYRATDTDSLTKIYDEIDQLEKSTASVKRFDEYRELFPWLLVAAMLLLGAELVLGETRLRRLP